MTIEEELYQERLRVLRDVRAVGLERYEWEDAVHGQISYLSDALRALCRVYRKDGVPPVAIEELCDDTVETLDAYYKGRWN